MGKSKLHIWLIEEEGGQGIVEYSFILVLIAIAVIGTLKLFGEGINNLYKNSTNKIP